MSKPHSPGPWGSDFGGRNIVAADRTVVCTINFPSGGDPATEVANKRLVIFAPELLDACRAILHWFDPNSPAALHVPPLATQANCEKLLGDLIRLTEGGGSHA